MGDVHLSLSSLRHGWGLVLVVVVMLSVVVALGLVLSDRQYLTAMVVFAGVAFLALMVKVVVTGLRGGHG